MTKKTKWVGRESGKSSDRVFRNPRTGAGLGLHARGDGASAGDGKTSDKSLLGKIVPVFRGIVKDTSKDE